MESFVYVVLRDNGYDGREQIEGILKSESGAKELMAKLMSDFNGKWRDEGPPHKSQNYAVTSPRDVGIRKVNSDYGTRIWIEKHPLGD